VSTVSAVSKRGSAAFTVPFNAPSPLPAGDPGIIVRLPDGSFVAYDAVCTHEGCTVEWDKPDGVLFCPCHGAAFDAANDAAVLQGPARRPLVSLPIVVDEASGTIYLKT
jgi:thiosulfate dehydrogenase [quinone] large subunit